MIVIPRRMGLMNQRALLEQLRRVGKASRADLSKSLGLSQPTTGKIADELIRMGLLEEINGDEENAEENALKESRLGRPGRLLRLNQRDKRFLAIQLGVKKTSFVTLPPGTNEEDQWMFDLQTPDNINDLEKVLETAARRIKVDSLWGVLVSVPGIVDENEGKVIFSPNLHWTENANLQVLIKNVWKAEALLMQEERALALGHHVVDAKGEDFFLVDFGEGIGGAAMVGGRLYSSSLPLSGELGHTPVCGNKRKCGCGATGCIETLVSERGLIESFSNITHNKNANWKDLVEHIKEHGLEPWLVDTLNATASVIAEALNVMGIRRVVMTGFISSLPKPVSDYLKEKIADGAMWARFGEVDVEIAPRRRTAGLVAAGIDKLVIPLHIKEK